MASVLHRVTVAGLLATAYLLPAYAAVDCESIKSILREAASMTSSISAYEAQRVKAPNHYLTSDFVSNTLEKQAKKCRDLASMKPLIDQAMTAERARANKSEPALMYAEFYAAEYFLVTGDRQSALEHYAQAASLAGRFIASDPTNGATKKRAAQLLIPYESILAANPAEQAKIKALRAQLAR